MVENSQSFGTTLNYLFVLVFCTSVVFFLDWSEGVGRLFCNSSLIIIIIVLIKDFREERMFIATIIYDNMAC